MTLFALSDLHLDHGAGSLGHAPATLEVPV